MNTGNFKETLFRFVEKQKASAYTGNLYFKFKPSPCHAKCLISKDKGHISIYQDWIWCVQISKKNYEQFPVFQTSPPLRCIFDWSVSIFDECLLFEKKIFLWWLLFEKNILFFVAAPSFIFDANVFLLPILLKHHPPSSSRWWWWWLTFIYD